MSSQTSDEPLRRGRQRGRLPGRRLVAGPHWRRVRDEDGQAMVEFALVAPLLVILLTAILQFGVMYNKYITLTDAVRIGARTLAMDAGLSDPCDAAITQTVNSASGTNLTASEVTTTLISPDTCGTGTYPSRTGASLQAGDETTVAAAVPYTISVFGLSVFHVQLSASASEAAE